MKARPPKASFCVQVAIPGAAKFWLVSARNIFGDGRDTGGARVRAGNELRLTGKHETCDINTFRSGVADRGASIRIPLPVQLQNKGYLEDRRPAANVDPYVVARLLLKTTFA